MTSCTDLVAATSLEASLVRQSANIESMQTMALQMGSMLTQLTTNQFEMRREQQELRTELTDSAEMLKQRLEALETSASTLQTTSTVSVKSIDSSPALRYALRFLMVAGMDTRTGLICGFPVMCGPTCYIAISLHLLKFSFNRIFKGHVTKGRAMGDFSRAFHELDAAVSRDCLEKAVDVLPITGEGRGRRVSDTWAMLKASRFVQLCGDLDARYPIEDDRNWSTSHLWEDGDFGLHVKEVEVPQRMKNDRTSADDYLKKNKVAWNVPVWRDILESRGVTEYVKLVAEARGEDVPDGPCHFSGLELYPTATVDDHPRVPIRQGKGAAYVNASSIISFQEEEAKEEEVEEAKEEVEEVVPGAEEDSADSAMERLLDDAETFNKKRGVDSDASPCKRLKPSI